MLIAVVFVACACAASAAEPPPPQKIHYDLHDAAKLFQDFKQKHKKVYSSAVEHLHRFQIFIQSLKRINELNSKSRNAVYGLNHFADFTEEEMNQLRGLKPLNESEIVRVAPALELGDAPPSFDWRERNVVSPIKSQGPCGSCYVFSAIANIESQFAMKHQQCLSLSEQQCLDCLPGVGCKGGLPHEVMNLLAQQRRACVKAGDYHPYMARQGQCEDSNRGRVTVQGGQVLAIHDEETLMKALVQMGPLSVSLNAEDLKHYHRGVMEPQYCNPQWPDHAVLLVGYGVDTDGTPFWSIKNSWGPEFGEQGYARLHRGINACGMGTMYAAISIVA